jgi:TPR repeat protein
LSIDTIINNHYLNLKLFLMEFNKLFVYSAFLILISCAEEIDPRIAFEKGDYTSAFPIWKLRAENGDLEAQNFLGIHYLLALGVRRDFLLARKWYEKAAIAGHPDAQRNLGMMYESGHGTPRDFENAYIWLYAAYRQGHPRAAASLESMVSKLSPNNKIVLRRKAREYIMEDVLEADANDF